MNLLIVEGGIHGREKNCGQIVHALVELSPFEATSVVYLSGMSILEKVICNADAILFLTGVYWDDCGWPLQKFLSDFTHLECDSRIMGKPAGVIVLCHSVGGKSVLSRLQGVLSSQGFLIPPLSGMVLSRDSMDSKDADSWGLADMDIVLQNLYIACLLKLAWRKWPVQRVDYDKVWVSLE